MSKQRELELLVQVRTLNHEIKDLSGANRLRAIEKLDDLSAELDAIQRGSLTSSLREMRELGDEIERLTLSLPDRRRRR